jgi:hypothetical protein
MGVTIRLADPIADRDALIAGLRDHLNPLTDRNRYDWLYLDNPDGVARIWVVEEEGSGRIVGSSSLVPRNVYIRGRESLGCVVADTWVHPDHRILGPALKLQRACLDDIGSSGFTFAYDFPRQAMPAIYKRLGAEPADSLQDYVRLLNASRHLEDRFGSSMIADIASLLVNPALRFACRPVRNSGLRFDYETGRCTSEFTNFHRSIVGQDLCVARTSAFLNWRYLDHFHLKHRILTARQDGRIAGYVVFAERHPRAEIVDVMSESGTVTESLLRALLTDLTNQGYSTASYSTLSTSCHAPALARLQFRLQSETPFIAILPGNAETASEQTFGEFSIGQEAD